MPIRAAAASISRCVAIRGSSARLWAPHSAEHLPKMAPPQAVGPQVVRVTPLAAADAQRQCRRALQQPFPASVSCYATSAAAAANANAAASIGRAAARHELAAPPKQAAPRAAPDSP